MGEVWARCMLSSSLWINYFIIPLVFVFIAKSKSISLSLLFDSQYEYSWTNYFLIIKLLYLFVYRDHRSTALNLYCLIGKLVWFFIVILIIIILISLHFKPSKGYPEFVAFLGCAWSVSVEMYMTILFKIMVFCCIFFQRIWHSLSSSTWTNISGLLSHVKLYRLVMWLRTCY